MEESERNRREAKKEEALSCETQPVHPGFSPLKPR
jgi:hypothetical protein